MTSNREITIGGRVYRKNPDVGRYQVHVDELRDLRMSEIPPHSHLEILGVVMPRDAFSLELYGLNGGDEGEHEYLEVYGGVSFKVGPDGRSRILTRLRRAFPERESRGFIPNPWISAQPVDGGFHANVHLNLNFKDTPDTLVRDAIAPFIEGFQCPDRPSVHAFICHASEDKPIARALASAMTRFGAEVWFDEWEIRVGDSIVQKIGAALGSASHLIVLLSRNSVNKPWVQKELSSALMRQLSERSVRVLPFRLDDCTIPPILADIKYADGRVGVEHALTQLEQSLFASSESDESA